MNLTLSLVSLGLALMPLPAQTTAWTKLSPTTNPPSRSMHAMVYDSARDRVVVFGGGGAYLNDTWEFDGKTWVKRSPKNAPGARRQHAMAYDSLRKRVILFGGTGPTIGQFGDTWFWDGANWSKRSPKTSPPPMRDHAMTYDSKRNVVVLYGGQWPFSRDVWEFDGSSWTKHSPSSTALWPPKLIWHAMAFDAKRGVTVVFGGEMITSPSTIESNELWEWDGKAWKNPKPVSRPPARLHHALAFDKVRERTVLFGGYKAKNGRVVFGDTWEWGGKNWTATAPKVSPAKRYRHALTYDSRRRRVILFGGQSGSKLVNDTWSYHPIHPASYATFGTGCSSSAGTPKLAAATGSLPWVGEKFTVEVSGLPKAVYNVPFLLVGASSKSWGSTPLPFDLKPLGAPGCPLLVSPDLMLLLTNSGGTTTLAATIPTSYTLLGLEIFEQAYVLDSSANTLGIAVSNGGVARIGAK